VNSAHKLVVNLLFLEEKVNEYESKMGRIVRFASGI